MAAFLPNNGMTTIFCLLLRAGWNNDEAFVFDIAAPKPDGFWVSDVKLQDFIVFSADDVSEHMRLGFAILNALSWQASHSRIAA